MRSRIHVSLDATGVAVDPVVIAGSHAIAGWVQGSCGGRVLLRNEHGDWRPVACAGDAFKAAAVLEQAGVSPADASRLAESLAKAEAELPEEYVKKLALFDETAPIDAGGGLPPEDMAWVTAWDTGTGHDGVAQRPQHRRRSCRRDGGDA